MPFIHETEFIIFDVETTGLSPRWGDRIVELAALKVCNFEIIGQYETLINPQREISYQAFRVNGISSQMVSSAPTAREVMPEFLQFIGGGCLVGHNIRFDLSFLDHELALAGQMPLTNVPVLDTIRMAKEFLPDLGGYSLGNVSDRLGVEIVKQHRAMADVHLTYQVFRDLTKMALRRDMDKLENLVTKFGHFLE